MKVTLGLLLKSQPALMQLIQLPVSSVVRKKIKDAYSSIKTHLDSIDEIRKEKITEFGLTDVAHDAKLLTEHENFKVFANEMETLAKEEVELNLPALADSEIKNSKGEELDFAPALAIDLAWWMS